MIGLHYKDEDERDDALASVARRCQSIGATLVFFGRESSCISARDALRRLDPKAIEHVRFCPAPLTAQEDASSWAEGAVAREWSAAGGPFIAWADSPSPALV